MAVNFKNLNEIQTFLENYPNSNLLIVSKNRSIEDIDQIYRLGLKLFGENKVQEASAKFKNYQHIDKIKLHLIGPLQSNKVAQALGLFDVIQSLDRKKIIQEILKEKKKNGNFKTKEFYIQLNIGKEKQKSGVSIEDIDSFYAYCLESQINIKGLMCIPPNNISPELFFDKMVIIRNKLDKKLLLSMGMSGDYIKALERGSDMIRVGSKIFS